MTAGVGFPVKLFGRSSIDVGFEFGMRDPKMKTVTIDNKRVGLVKQNYYKLSLGLSMFGEDAGSPDTSSSNGGTDLERNTHTQLL